MNMSYAFFDGAIITDTVQLLVLLFKTSVIFESVCEFFSQTNDVPIVGDFFRPILVESD